ncbi:MAG: Mov34/MPN/PAD-1 family protein [Candidatus Dormibacteria bacterium]
MNLTHSRQFQANDDILRETERALRAAGKDGYELFVLWTGRLIGDVFTVEHCYVPEQRSFRVRKGVCVRVEADELHKLNCWLFQHGQTLAVQLHTHPKEAYHSETDDTYPIVTTLGGLSIVIPDFCRHGLATAKVAVYRLTDRGWEELDSRLPLDLVPMLTGR